MINLKKQKNIKSGAGFAVLFAVLLASFLITLGISIFSISLKEIQIATSSRDSQVAYYAADSARECALYWYFKRAAFPACIDSNCTIYDINGTKVPADPQINVSNIVCNNITEATLTFTKDNLTYTSNKVTNFFQASSTSSSTPVADIRITNKFIKPGVETTIEAWGHNTGILGRRVERGFTKVIK